jgi:hypothetical protein
MRLFAVNRSYMCLCRNNIFLVFYAISYLFFIPICFCIDLRYLSRLSNLVSFQPLMLIVPDVQDVYTPLQTDLILPISEVCV